VPAQGRGVKPPPFAPFRPGFWRSPLRGPWLTTLLGTLLLCGVTVVALTGFLSNAAYEPGVVAMAKAGNEPAGTGGSQFFVVTGSSTGLTPDYALLGRVTDGMDVVQAIAELGDPASGGAGTPLQSVVVEKATVRER